MRKVCRNRNPLTATVTAATPASAYTVPNSPSRETNTPFRTAELRAIRPDATSSRRKCQPAIRLDDSAPPRKATAAAALNQTNIGACTA